MGKREAKGLEAKECEIGGGKHIYRVIEEKGALVRLIHEFSDYKLHEFADLAASTKRTGHEIVSSRRTHVTVASAAASDRSHSVQSASVRSSKVECSSASVASGSQPLSRSHLFV